MKFISQNIIKIMTTSVISIFIIIAPSYSQETCNSDFIASIQQNDLSKFHELLNSGVSINCITFGRFDGSPLSLAVQSKRVEMVKALLAKGASVNTRIRDGLTPIMLVGDDRNLQITKLLLSYGANPNIKAKNGFSVISRLARDGKFEECEFILDHGGDPNIIDGNGDTLANSAWHHIQYVIYDEERAITFISTLRKRGLDLTIENEDGKTIADLAYSSRFIDLLKLVDVSGKYHNKIASIKPITQEEKLFRAIGRSDVPAVKRLLDSKPDLLVQDPQFKAPALILAAKEKSPELVSLILKAGSPVGVTDSNGGTALDQAVYAKHLEAIDILLKADAKPTEQTLYSAVLSGSLEMVKKVLETGLDVNARGKENYTALMCAVRNKNMGILNYLLEHGADTTIKNSDGKSAADYAAEQLDLDILRRVDKRSVYKDFLASYTPKKDSPFIGTWIFNPSGSWSFLGIMLKNDGTAYLNMMLGTFPAIWKEQGNQMELSAIFDKSKITIKGTLIETKSDFAKKEDKMGIIAKGDHIGIAETILTNKDNSKYALKVSQVEEMKKPEIKDDGKEITVDQVKKNEVSIDDLIWIIKSNKSDLRQNIPWDKLSADVLHQLAAAFIHHREPNITIAAQSNCNEKALNILSDGPDEVKKVVAKHKNTSLVVLKKLTAKDQNIEVRLAAAQNAKMAPDLYEQILNEGSKSLKKEKRMIVARDLRTKNDILTRLSLDVEDDVKREVARNKNTPNSVLEKMEENADLRLRAEIALNPNCSPQFLNLLSKNQDEQVRRAVAHNENVPAVVLERLAKDTHSAVRDAVTENKKTPEYVLQILTSDSYSGIKRKAKERLRESNKGSGSKSQKIE